MFNVMVYDQARGTGVVSIERYGAKHNVMLSALSLDVGRASLGLARE